MNIENFLLNFIYQIGQGITFFIYLYLVYLFFIKPKNKKPDLDNSHKVEYKKINVDNLKK